MQLTKTQVKVRCELGICRNAAEFTVAPSHVGIRSRLHVCRGCLSEICALFEKEKAQEKAQAKASAGAAHETPPQESAATPSAPKKKTKKAVKGEEE
ncbi:MAG: hypothetical protein FWH03_01250 [Firmicutes bacterium]|nr:hypothetical protein [Bacillota bacterium]